MSLTRRAAIQALGAAALPVAARATTPTDDEARALARRAAVAPSRILQGSERATVASIADAILPRTDSIGALDAGVPAYIEFITAEWMNESERMAFREGLRALEAHATQIEGAAWPALDRAAQAREASWAESPEERTLPAKSAFRRIKGLTIQGYFVSERVQKEVLKTNITPGRYFGCTPIPAPPSGDGEADVISEVRYSSEGSRDA